MKTRSLKSSLRKSNQLEQRVTSDPEEALAILEGELAVRTRSNEQNLTVKSPLRASRSDTMIPDTVSDDGFDETCYVSVFPDVAEAIANGECESGRHHFMVHGTREGRLNDLRYRNAVRAQDTANFPAGDIDVVFVSRSGWCLVIGWLNDEKCGLSDIACVAGTTIVATAAHAGRCRREDAETAISPRHGKLLGFWTVFKTEDTLLAVDELGICLRVGNEQKTFRLRPQMVSEERLREAAVEYFAAARYFANPQFESSLQLQGGLGAALVRLNVAISSRIIAGAHVTRFGPPPSHLDGSIVVCLYGKAEYLFLQAASFSSCPGADRYEYIYVSNSPELAETLIKEAAIAGRIYGLHIVLVILPSNAGFGAANNIAVEHARSNRILIVNPDVFPRDSEWAARHNAIVQCLPSEQTAMFGAPLYYDDGSLMHAGMFFEIDAGVSIRDDLIEPTEIIRVEHYAKGAPPDTASFLLSHRVPAVTGAFISAERTWFELLGGFSMDYVFGHYEDADLCLKSLTHGVPVWVHHVPFWHLEGKGSTRRPVHEGGSSINRWHFATLWKDIIARDLSGRAPARFAL